MRRGGGGENSVWLAYEHIYAFCLFKNSGHSRRSVSNLAWNNTISECLVYFPLFFALLAPNTLSKSRSSGENDNDGSG
ncbi:unnamed protein product [Macrosiphum euphorbiae]|uniref:Uncharacterized protein n=1 Tax=Macrosiphum euphorbiae TaxID=13131 RepID=A0AAV0VVC4_9HEMI|nr:unnamed protein product [Macrosiphum euphorbiae]